jgi:hypothetical protein
MFTEIKEMNKDGKCLRFEVLMANINIIVFCLVTPYRRWICADVMEEPVVSIHSSALKASINNTNNAV